ncbi:hypothetical protein BaRGS_00022047 [Batillaria attramentaria]|uniref:Peptidase M14 domain-containing protein n=1 Tax=Batillaria attramentaria TaxID=370345 RepID=A0ABD0KI65_9CAEN
MLPELTTLKNTFPDLVFFDDSGNTPARSRSQADNRIIHVIELGANRGSTDVIMLEVNIHAREHITAAANLYFMDWVLSNYGSNENATFLLDNYHFVIMPVANPDGYDYSFVSSNTAWAQLVLPDKSTLLTQLGEEDTCNPECTQGQCCVRIGMAMTSRKRSAFDPLVPVHSELLCQPLKQAGEKCLLRNVNQEWCDCAPGLTCTHQDDIALNNFFGICR